MSAQALLQAAIRAALQAHAPLVDALTAVFDAPPVRCARPYAVIEDAIIADWGTKDIAGREGRFAVMLHDIGERPERVRLLIGEIEAAIESMPRTLGEGWHIASLILLRSRIAREGEAQWLGASEWRVRMLRSEL